MLDQLNWIDYLKMAVQLLVFIATFFVSAGTATIARLAVVLDGSLIQLIDKVDKLIKALN
jgi:hypothetical protein